MRRKLHSLRLREGDSVQKHIKAMTELFDALSVVGDPVTEEDRVVFLLASLPESYDILVTALEANADVPKMEVVTERLLHEERKLKERSMVPGNGGSDEKGMMSKHRPFRRQGPRCYYCGKLGHIQRNCGELSWSERKNDNYKMKQNANHAGVQQRDENCSDSEDAVLTACHVSSVSQQNGWIVDSGATSHMCNNRKLFTKMHTLEKSLEVMLGDGHVLEATGKGIVMMDMRFPNGNMQRCKLHDVLYVPSLFYNLLSVSRATQRGKVMKFGKVACHILNSNGKIIARATKVGSLYHLDCETTSESANVADETEKEDIWHCRFGHLGTGSLQKLAKDRLVEGLD